MVNMEWVQRIKAFGARRSALPAVVVILIVYLLYLPTSGYERLYFDAEEYWTIAKQYYPGGDFSFLSYFTFLRGYFFPLFLAPLTQFSAANGFSPLAVTQVQGACVAALVFGWCGPALWQAVRGGAAPSLGRRLVFAGLGFVVWRDYFNFCLTDFLALLALGISLMALLRGQGVRSALVAGIALAAAANMRPVYQLAVPAVAVLALLPGAGGTRRSGLVRGGALVLGAAFGLLPQTYSNHHHAGITSPWVQTHKPGEPNLYLNQLGWGLFMQKYETTIGRDYSETGMRFIDGQGLLLLKSTGQPNFTEASQYVRLCLAQPGPVAGVWLRHLFNGLDVQYSTPYIKQVYVTTWPLAWLNYTIIWGGLLMLVSRRWARPSVHWLRPGLVVLALLVPCMATLPTAMECRFLLALHLLFAGTVAFGAKPLQWWRAASRRWRTGVVLSYAAFVVAGFAASAGAQLSLERTPRQIDTPLDFLDDVELNGLRTPSQPPEPW